MKRTVVILLRNPLSAFGVLLVTLVVLSALLADLIAPFPEHRGAVVDFANFNQPPSARHFMGTDLVGRDLFSRIIYAYRISLMLGFVVLSIAVPIGVTIGLVAGYMGGRGYPHHQTGDRKLETGDAVVVDIGAVSDGWPSDITRMLAIGTPPEGCAEVHAVVERAVQAALAAARPGVAASAVDAAAREVIAAAGYGEFFVHRTGHGIGIEGHEPPWITSTSETVLDAGMSFSIEPGIYIPGRFGIRLEEIVVLRGDGPEILSDLPRDLVICDD